MTSNTATTEVLLPVLAGAAGAMGVNPLLIMIPATLSASCAFMLPIATPPNAIVFGSGELEMRDMIRAGLILNLHRRDPDHADVPLRVGTAAGNRPHRSPELGAVARAEPVHMSRISRNLGRPLDGFRAKRL